MGFVKASGTECVRVPCDFSRSCPGYEREWFTFGAAVGANVLERGDWLAGLYLGLHSRAYGGTR
jgi:hypothetical protein